MLTLLATYLILGLAYAMAFIYLQRPACKGAKNLDCFLSWLIHLLTAPSIICLWPIWLGAGLAIQIREGKSGKNNLRGS